MRKVLYVLGELKDGDLQWLAGAGETRAVAAGDVLITEGQPVGTLFIVLDGELAVSVRGNEVARLEMGEIVGDMSMLDSRPPNATVSVSEEGQVFAVPHSTLRAKLSSDDGFASRFYRAMAIFLANRLTQTTAMATGLKAEVSLDEDDFDMDELTMDAMDSVGLAGSRFVWFVNEVRAD